MLHHACARPPLQTAVPWPDREGHASTVLTISQSCEQVLVRESRSSFLFYASGRRFCQSLTARMHLQQRQDLLSLVYYKFTPRDDFVDMEVHMNDSSMPPLVRPDP